MGSPAGRPDEQPAHEVVVEPFRAARAPVSNAEYTRFVQASGSPDPRFAADPAFSHPALPVVGVSWHEATRYCEWLAFETGLPLRLPTEAEREFAARGGISQADWPWGREKPQHCDSLQAIANLNRPHTPAPACANGFGLLCMAENVHEWCSDWNDLGYYALSPARDPLGPATGLRRASRGGSWRHAVKFTRVSARSSLDPTFRYNDYGFRVYADA